MLFWFRCHLLAALFLLQLGCQPLVTTFDDVEEAVDYRAASIGAVPGAVDTLLIMTWNIKFGGGDIDFWFDCWGDRVLMTGDEVLDNLEGVVAKINQVDPDILLLQEVDVDSKRSTYLDQLQYILDHTDMNYGVFASMWQSQYIPSTGLGRVNTGNAILSRWPLDNAERIALALRTDQDPVTRFFYLRRNILKATVDLPGYGGANAFHVVNVHTAAFSQDGTKQKHINQFKAELDKIAGEGDLFVAGGDLNEIPPNADKTSNFVDSKCEEGAFQADDYSGEMDWLNAFYALPAEGGYIPAVSLANFQEKNSAYFSHSTDPRTGFKRKLDYLFTNHQGGWVPGSAVTHQDISFEGRALSDHAPVSVKLVLP